MSSYFEPTAGTRMGVLPNQANEILLTAGAAGYAYPAGFTEIAAAGHAFSKLVGVQFNDRGVGDLSSFQLEINQGAAGFEVVIAETVINKKANAILFPVYWLPIQFVKGARLSCRLGDVTGGLQIGVKLLVAV